MTRHYNSLIKFLEVFKMKAPEHPLLCYQEYDFGNDTANCKPEVFEPYTTDFYSVSLKKITLGEMYYGNTKYDFNNGVLMLFPPNKKVEISNINLSGKSYSLVFHKDFLLGTSVQDSIGRYGYFSYTVNEALHLSPREEEKIIQIFKNISDEYNNNIDEFSKEIIISNIDALLKYSERYYKRQFITRKVINNGILDKFNNVIEDLYSSQSEVTIPKIENIAGKLNFSPRYLSDLLKNETGKTAIEHIQLFLIDKSKELLLGSDNTVSEIAYKLGFEYPHYYSRLFKKSEGITPTEFRKTISQN